MDFAALIHPGYEVLLAHHFSAAIIDNMYSDQPPAWLSHIIPLDAGIDMVWEH